jgi:UDP-N-acetylmuramoyl-tripeptide--D-alanyl-D-alanine ligase
VNDVLDTLQQLAAWHRQQLDIPFIAITGSNGKTTTKELIHVVLSAFASTSTTEGNLNNHIGVPLTLLKIKRDARFAIIEMGANHLKEIESYCRIARPTHGLITNCGKAHLEGFGSEEGIRKGKGELFDFLRENAGTAFVMWDYRYLRDMSRGIPELVRYGTEAAAITGQASRVDPFLEVTFSKGFSGSIKTALVGGYNLPNVLAAVAVGNYFKVPEEMIRSAIEGYRPSNSRSQMVEIAGNKIILDAYNANPSSMKLAIENLAQATGDNKILVLGAMAELGSQSLAEHEEIIHDIQKYKWKEVLLVGGDFQKIDHPFRKFGSASEAGSWLQRQSLRNACLLVKGSRSMQMEKVLDYLKNE